MDTGTALRRLAQGSLTLITSNVAGALLGFGLSLVIARGLGEAGFGRWTFCLAWASALTMTSEFGLSTLLTRQAARSRREANAYLAGSLFVKLALSAVLGGAVFFASPALGTDAASSAALRLVLPLTMAATAYGSFTALFRAAEWMTPILWLNSGGLALQLAGAIWILRSGCAEARGCSPLLALVAWAAMVQAAQLVVAFGLWWTALRPGGGPLRPSVTLVRAMLWRAAPFAAASLLGAIQLRSSPLLLGYLRGPAEVGLFAAAWRFSEAAKLIPNGIFNAAFSAFAAHAQSAGAGVLFRAFQRVLAVLAVGLALLLVVFAQPVLHLTFGPEFLPAASTLVWLGIGLVPALWNGAMEVYLYAAGDEAYAARLGALGTLVQVAASLPLIAGLGASGAAIAVVVGEVVLWLPLRARTLSRLAETKSAAEA